MNQDNTHVSLQKISILDSIYLFPNYKGSEFMIIVIEIRMPVITLKTVCTDTGTKIIIMSSCLRE